MVGQRLRFIDLQRQPKLDTVHIDYNAHCHVRCLRTTALTYAVSLLDIGFYGPLSTAPTGSFSASVVSSGMNALISSRTLAIVLLPAIYTKFVAWVNAIPYFPQVKTTRWLILCLCAAIWPEFLRFWTVYDNAARKNGVFTSKPCHHAGSIEGAAERQPAWHVLFVSFHNSWPNIPNAGAGCVILHRGSLRRKRPAGLLRRHCT